VLHVTYIGLSLNEFCVKFNMMKTLIPILLFISFHLGTIGQTTEPFDVSIEEVSIDGLPGLHSFTRASYDNKWLLIGGRTDGLHQRQPFAAFLASDNNGIAYVVDPVNDVVYSASLSALPQAMSDQLQSTNMQFEQRDSMLYIIGGYGYSNAESDHHTYPNLSAVHVPDVMDAIINGNSIAPHFRQITDTRLQVTGGYLDRLDETYYLAGGQKFEGRYNPMGPTHGPGFVQEYTNAIRRFQIIDDGTNLSISDYDAWIDSDNLHRRDYNMAPQIFPNGERGFTMFSGVFQHDQNLPWLNTVDVVDTAYAVRAGFNQYLSQYHSAHLNIFGANDNAMHTVFFGGISRYTMDENNQLVDDEDVPFVKTISKIVRYADDTMEEIKIGEMPGFLGSGAEFIPIENQSWYNEDELLLIDALPSSKVLVGYIVGGIESTDENIFFVNTGSQSDASTRVFEVYIQRDASSVTEPINGTHYFKTKLYPNPAVAQTHFTFETPDMNNIKAELYDMEGRLVKQLFEGSTNGESISINTSELSTGTYIIKLSSPQYQQEIRLGVVHE